MGCGASSVQIAQPNQVEPEKIAPPSSALKKLPNQQSVQQSDLAIIQDLTRDYNQNVSGTENAEPPPPPGGDAEVAGQQPPRKPTLPNGIAEIKSNADVIHRMPGILKRVSPSSRFAHAVLELKELRRLANHDKISEETDNYDHRNYESTMNSENERGLLKSAKPRTESMITNYNLESLDERARGRTHPPQPPWNSEAANGNELPTEELIVKTVAIQVELMDLIDGIKTQSTQTDYQLTAEDEFDLLMMGDDHEGTVIDGARLVNDEVTVDSEGSDCECDHPDLVTYQSHHHHGEHVHHPQDNDVVSSSVEYATIKDDDLEDEDGDQKDGPDTASSSITAMRGSSHHRQHQRQPSHLPAHLQQRRHLGSSSLRREPPVIGDEMSHKSVLLQAEIHHHQSIDAGEQPPAIESPALRRVRLGKMGSKMVNQRLQPILAMNPPSHLLNGARPHGAVVTVDVAVQVKVQMITVGTQTRLSTITRGTKLRTTTSTLAVPSAVSGDGGDGEGEAAINKSASIDCLPINTLSTTPRRPPTLRSDHHVQTLSSSCESIDGKRRQRSRTNSKFDKSVAKSNSGDTSCDQDEGNDEEATLADDENMPRDSEADDESDQTRSIPGQVPHRRRDSGVIPTRRPLPRGRTKKQLSEVLEVKDIDELDEIDSNMEDGDAAADLVGHIGRELLGDDPLNRIESVQIQDCLLNKLLDEIESSESLIATMKQAAMHRRISTLAISSQQHLPLSPSSSMSAAIESASLSSHKVPNKTDAAIQTQSDLFANDDYLGAFTPRPPPTLKKEMIPDLIMFKDMDKKAIETPTQLRNSLQGLVEYLCESAWNDLFRIRAIFRWIAHNIAFDWRHMDVEMNTAEILRRSEGVCKHYCQLLCDMCAVVNIRCKRIQGFARGHDYRPGHHFIPHEDPLHTWNAVYILGSWRLIDPTWGTGFIDHSGKFVRKLNEHFFLTDPETMIWTHFPFNEMEDNYSRWQLLDKPLTLEEFNSQPKVSPTFFEYNLKVRSKAGNPIVVKVQTDIKIGGHEPMRWKYKFYPCDELENSALNNYAFCQLKEERFVGSFTIVPPIEGRYFFKIYAKPERDMVEGQDSSTLQVVITFQIDCIRARKYIQPYPLNEVPWGPTQAFFDYNMKLQNQVGPVVQTWGAKRKLVIETHELMLITFQVFDADGMELDPKIIINREDVEKRITFSIQPPRVGMFKLMIFGMPKPNKKGKWRLPLLATFLIECKMVRVKAPEEDEIMFIETRPSQHHHPPTHSHSIESSQRSVDSTPTTNHRASVTASLQSAAGGAPGSTAKKREKFKPRPIMIR